MKAAKNLNLILQPVMILDKPVTLTPKQTYTKSRYAKDYSVSRPTVDKMIKDGDLKTIEVKGTTLIVL